MAWCYPSIHIFVRLFYRICVRLGRRVTHKEDCSLSFNKIKCFNKALKDVYGLVIKFLFSLICDYSKTCLKRPLSKRAKLFFKTDYLLMQVKSIAECSKGSILQYF